MNSEVWKNKVLKASYKLKLAYIYISNYITVAYETNWWLQYVLQKNEEFDEVKMV